MTDPRVGEPVITTEALAERVRELGREISEDYAGETLLVVGVLKGAFVFLADLIRELSIPVEVEFLAVSSYGKSTRTSGVVRILKDLDVDIGGRHVLLVEDIADSGLTLRYLRKALAARRPASFEVCALLVREGQRELDELVHYAGFRVPAGWLVGYGLDVAHRHRQFPDIRAYRDGDDHEA